MTEIDLKFLVYRRHVRDCVGQIQTEMALGYVKSEDSLLQHIASVTMFDGAVEAFTFFNNSAPYEWSEYVTPELLAKCNNDLGMVAIAVTNQVVTNDVYSAISETDGYRLLTEGKQTKKIRWKIENQDVRRFTLREVWKSHASLYDHLIPHQIRNYKGKSLAVFRRDEGDGDISYTILLEHEDPTLIWKSKRHYVEHTPPVNSVEYYEEQKCEVLLHYDCPSDSLWLTEVQTSEQFYEHFCTDTEAEEGFYGLHDYEFVIYYHESGEVHSHAGFNNDEEFDQACKVVAKYLK
jgi:hypothetical protein